MNLLINKRGFIRTLEAVIAIVIVFLFIFYASKSSTGEDKRFVEGIKSLQESILNDISKNNEFRKCIVEYNPLDQNNNSRDDISDESAYAKADNPCSGTGKISDFIDESVPTRFRKQGEHFEFIVCNFNIDCKLPSIEGDEVYTSAVIITSSLKNTKYKPRILRIWFF